MRKTELLQITLLIMILGLTAGLYTLKSKFTDLEIYTDRTIYYIRGLTVTSEVDKGTTVFNSAEELREYMSYKTAMDIKE